jgi:hypothetical protein
METLLSLNEFLFPCGDALEKKLFVLTKVRAMDGTLEFDEHGRESNSHKAKTYFSN